MANLTKEQRQAKYQEANRLARLGYSRRQINPILKEKYGEGIRPAKYTPIFRERVSVVKQKEEARPAPRRRFRPSRQDRYDWLVARHFTDDEATRLSKLRGLQDSKGIAKMVAVRSELWNRFIRIAAERGWSKETRRTMWRRGLSRWYRRNGYITKRTFRGKRRPTTWGWYKDIQKQLPIEDQDDTPRLHDRGFTPRYHITPTMVNWTKNLHAIRRLMDNPKYKDRLPELRREERRVLSKIREEKRK